MEDRERLTVRLDNIQAVEPILSALRTIALGSRLLALNRIHDVHQYRQNLLHILALVSPHLPKRYPIHHETRWTSGNIVLLVIGSERGLCGALNDTVAEYAEQVLANYTANGATVMLMTLGARMLRAFRRKGRSPVWSGRLSVAALPPYQLACELTSKWLQSYEKHELDAVEVVYNAYRGLTRYEPSTVRMLPPPLSPLIPEEPEWPPVIETDPLGLYIRVAKLWLSASLYGTLVESAAAEHSARYQLLDGATRNAERLMEELKLFLQVARQEAITSEMQDLASGAGQIGPRSD